MTLKKIILIGFLGHIISCGTQEKITSAPFNNLPNEFFQQWKLDYAILNGGKVIGYPPSPEQDYLFNADGTYILYSKMNENRTGTWEYSEAKKCVYIKRNDGGIKGIIKDIQPNSFTLIPPKNAVEDTPLKNLTFYYIPKNN